jgi:LmbE family N-acetylglucosaminyl deacetylase
MTRVLVVVAHCDDEVIGWSAWLDRYRREIRILHVTNSVPQNPEFYRKRGYEDPAEYGRIRRAEMLEAVGLLGVKPEQCEVMAIADGDAANHVEEIARRVRELDPELVATHAYEGGHPDHDACAAACQWTDVGERWEAPYYHAKGVGRFLENRGDEVEERVDPEVKRRLFGCFPSQGEVLGRFALDVERVRRAGVYDFGRPPHEGRLYYEGRPVGWTFREWASAVGGRSGFLDQAGAT